MAWSLGRCCTARGNAGMMRSSGMGESTNGIVSSGMMESAG